MSILLKFQRKDALVQIASDLLRHSVGTNNPEHLLTARRSVRSSALDNNSQELRIQLKSMTYHHHYDYHKALRRFSIFSSTSQPETEPFSSTSVEDCVDFSQLSALNRKSVFQQTKLQDGFIQSHRLQFTKDAKNIIFVHHVFETKDEPKQYPILYPLKSNYYKESRIVIKNNGNEPENNYPTKFRFLTFDQQLTDLLLYQVSEEILSDNSNKYFNNDNIVIFDDPLEASIFHQETGIPVIVLGFGANEERKIREICRKLNKNFAKIYIWSNSVDFLRSFRNYCLKHFDPQRFVRITETVPVLKLIQECKHDKKELLEKILLSTSALDRPGVIHVNKTREQLFKYLNDPGHKGKQWTRFVKLNEQLKGHRPGELTIITGPTGSGKTTFVSEYSLDLCAQGVPTLWGSFELRYMTLEKTMMTQLIGRQFDPTNRQEFNDTFNAFSRLPLYFLNFHGQTDIEIVLEEAKHAVLMKGIEHLVIDNLQFMLGLSSDATGIERFHKQDSVIALIRQFATEYQCHVTLVAHPRKEKEEMELSNNSLYGGVKASQEADNVLILMNKYNARYRCSKYIQITKNRAYGNLGVLPLYFDKNSLCFSAGPTPNKTDSTQVEKN